MPGSLPWPAEPLADSSKRKVLAVALVALVALVAAGVWALISPNAYAQSANGCVNVVAAVSTGGALIHECGAQATAWCRSEDSIQTTFAHLVQAQCRLAGIEPGAAS